MSTFNRFSLKRRYAANLLLILMTVLLTACGGISPFAPKPTGTPMVVEPVVSAADPAAVAQQAAVAKQAVVPLTGKGQVFRVEISDNAFTAPELFVPAGATVIWTNSGKHAHTVTSDDGSFDSGSLESGDTFEHEFDQVGTIVYHCSIHGSAGGHDMAGAVTVVSASQAGVVPAAAASSMGGMEMSHAGAESTAAAPAAAAPVAVAAEAAVAGQAGAPGQSGVAKPAPNGVKRVFYIAAVEVEWNYAPSGKNQITGQPFGDVENVFVGHGPNRIGSIYTKAVYREFTDDTFTQQKPIPPEWQHLGIMGPVIHAEVGDTIIVHYMNKTSIPTSMHPHGVFYNKDSEGAGYNDGTGGADKEDDAVPPDGTHTYTWEVPERAGPGPNDPRSIMWMYHSHVDEPGDTNGGLMGAIIISARGNANPDGTPKDVDREFVITFSVMDENASPFLQHNIDTKTSDPGSVNPDDEEFHESNLMHSINGYVYGNIPGLVMKKGERVRWYVMGMGTEVDLHTPHWHGNVVQYMGMNMDVIELLPASMKVVDMVPDNPGTWLLHCHVNDHIVAGMQATYTVEQ